MTTFAKQARIYYKRIATRRRDPIKKSSCATVKSMLRAAWPTLAHLEIESINGAELKALAERLVAEDYSSNYIEDVVTTAKLVIASDLDKDGNPKHKREWNNGFILEAVSNDKKKSPLIKAERLEALITQAPPIIREFIITQAASGCRKGELLALRPSDLNVAGGFLSVTRTLSQHGETSTKTDAGTREVDLAPEIVAMLVALLDGRTTGRLFDITIDELRRALEALNLKSHSLRHFRYTHLERHKVHPAIHAYWIGHSMGGLRKIYGHIEEDRELRQRLAREIGIGFSLPVAVNADLPELVATA